MQSSNYSYQSPSMSSSTSNYQSPMNGLKSPESSDFEYLGRLVTRERPVIRKSNSVQQNIVYPPNQHKYHHSMESYHQEAYDEESVGSSEDEIDHSDGLSKPLGVIRINDRHLREVYRLPTPPPTIRRVYHRLRSPEPKVIERVFVRRPPPQIIENIIEVPPERVHIINREKYLGKSTPVTRSKLVHLKSRRHHREIEEQEETNFIPSEQYSQQQTTTIPLTTPQPGTTTSLVYPPQSNLPTVGYIESTVPPHIMFNTQQPLQLQPQQISNHQIPPSYPQQQQTFTHNTAQPTSYNYPSQQTFTHHTAQPTSYNYPSQQAIPNTPYGYRQY